MGFLSFHEIVRKARNAFNRFPITLVWAITGSLIFIGIVNVDPDLLFDEYSNSLLTFILGISWLIGTQFFIEQLKNPEKWYGLKLVVVGLLVLFYWHLPDLGQNDVNPKFYIRFFLYLIAGHVFLFFAPFVLRWNNAAYWNYLKAVCIAIGRSILFSGVLYLGLVLALVAIKYLFDYDIPGKRYGQLFILCLGVVNTWTYLSDFPKDILQQTTIKYNKALEVFVKYILIPLVLLYIVILYAYTLKIVLAWNLPKGWVSYLVTALALLGFLIQLMINPIQKTLKSWTINHFYPWFYFLLFPLIVLLFTAIFKRIGDYGITENRYFVLLIALWILGITCYLLFSRKKQLKILSISLFILAILSSFGFWGAFKVSENSQVNQFKKVFEQVKQNNNLASVEQYGQLKSIIDYLADHRSVSRLDPIVGLSVAEICRDTTEGSKRMYTYNAPKKLLDSIGIATDPEDGMNYAYGDHFNYHTQWNAVHNYPISGYDYFASINFTKYDKRPMKIGLFNIYFEQTKHEIRLSKKPNSSGALVIPIREKLIALTKQGTNLNEVDQKELMLESKNDSLFAKLIFLDLGYSLKKDSLDVNELRAYLFLKQD
ncbi:MAG: DUF4153 domain-containing protein [Saonia sp.]